MFEGVCDEYADEDTERIGEIEANIFFKAEKEESSISFQMRPDYDERFKATPVREVIQNVMAEELTGKTYSSEEAQVWTKKIAAQVRDRVKELKFKRYKYLVQVVLGEQHGAGINIGCRCLWDAATDNYASDSFISDTIFCVTVVFAVYFY